MPKTQQLHIVQRGCGWPKTGHIYLFVPSGNYGTPIWEFLIDPTQTLPDEFSLSRLGMTLKSRGCYNSEGKEIFDIWDWIGAGNYPNPTDWLLEVSQFGLHQLIEKTTEWDKLTPESYYIAVHERAYIVNSRELYENRIGTEFPVCPYDYEAHIQMPGWWLDQNETCPGIFFNDIKKGEVFEKDTRKVVRKMPSFEYHAVAAIDPNAQHEPAAFFKMPIGLMGTFLVYKDNEQNTHLDALKELEKLDAELSRIEVIDINDFEKG